MNFYAYVKGKYYGVVTFTTEQIKLFLKKQPCNYSGTFLSKTNPDIKYYVID